MDITWKKIPGKGIYEDQWEAQGIEALIRESGGIFAAYFKGKRIAEYTTLSSAKKAVQQRIEY